MTSELSAAHNETTKFKVQVSHVKIESFGSKFDIYKVPAMRTLVYFGVSMIIIIVLSSVKLGGLGSSCSAPWSIVLPTGKAVESSLGALQICNLDTGQVSMI